METPTLLTVPEAARRLALGRATAYRLVQTGDLPSVRIGRTVRVPAAALDTWVRARTTGGILDPPEEAQRRPVPLITPRRRRR